MLISTLVIATAYTAYSVVIKSYGAYNKKHTLLADAVKLNLLLQRDFRQADIITRDSSGITCSGQIDTINYIINESDVFRISGITDTFRVETTDMAYTFNNIPVTKNADSLN